MDEEEIVLLVEDENSLESDDEELCPCGVSHGKPCEEALETVLQYLEQSGVPVSTMFLLKWSVDKNCSKKFECNDSD